jgi:hypothetical protein
VFRSFLRDKTIEVKVKDDKPMATWEKTLLEYPSGVKIEDHQIKQISESANDFVTKTAVTVGIVFAGVKVINTICDIAKIAAKARL